MYYEAAETTRREEALMVDHNSEFDATDGNPYRAPEAAADDEASASEFSQEGRSSVPDLLAQCGNLLAQSRPAILFLTFGFGLASVAAAAQVAWRLRLYVNVPSDLYSDFAWYVGLQLLGEIAMSTICALLCYKLYRYALAIREVRFDRPVTLKHMLRTHRSFWNTLAVVAALYLIVSVVWRIFSAVSALSRPGY